MAEMGPDQKERMGMVKDYFTPIEFKEEEEVVTPVETDELPFYKEPLDVIEREIQRMQDGTSDLKQGFLYLTKGQCPATEALKRLKDRPGKKNLKIFLELAEQDFGARAAQWFKNEVSKRYPEVWKDDE